MKLSKMVSLAAVLLAAAAAVLCYHLLVKHVTGSSGAAWFDAGCRDAGEKGGGADCAAVLASPYSYWPPKRVDEAPNTPHIPVAFLGLVYYSVLGVWLIGVGRPSRARRWLHLVPMVTIGLGLAGSVYFTFIMFTMLEEWCPWCL
ncbi:MAG: vitamin K epoxide reductase family protein, partial [Phycisphaerae bacterium]